MVSGHQVLRKISVVIAGGWLASITFYFLLAPFGLTWGYTLISFLQAALFRRIASKAITPWPLFMVAIAAIMVNLLATISSLNFWWSAFALNRLFDLMLLYLAGCALFRIVRTRQKRKGAPSARPQSFEIFAPAYTNFR